MKTERKPTATERTVSLFTGKTDLDVGGGRARDGSVVEEQRSSVRRKLPLRWSGGVSRWAVEETRNGRTEETQWIQKRHDGYHAWANGRSLGVFATIIAAGDACEAAS